MTTLLEGMRVVEHGAFIAGPSATLSLARFGADVIRIDPIHGGIDNDRWPITSEGRSLYWAGFNKGKRSVRIDLLRPEGQELAQRIVCAPGDAAGLFVSNLPAKGWMAYDALRAHCEELIMISIVGSRDGKTAIDYTANAAVGFPLATGPKDWTAPVNHVLPAWDFLCGMTAASALLAAERYRRQGHGGQLMRIALVDVALAAVGDMGLIAEVQLNGSARGRLGNDIYGAFGRDFETSDGRSVMIAAVSRGQWAALCRSTGITEAVGAYETAHGIDLASETQRFEAREAVAGMLAPWFAARTLMQVSAVLDEHRVCWGPYQSFEQLVAEDPRCSVSNPLFDLVDHPGIGTTLTPRTPVEVVGAEQRGALAAPLLGEHTDEVLGSVLGLGDAEIARLHDRKIVAGAD